MSKKDIFDLFRDNEHKLQQAPSPQTWNRLERRLESRRRARQRGRYVTMRRPLGMVASLALLLALTAVFLWLGRSTVDTNTAVAIMEQPVELEELAIAMNDDTPVSEIAEKAIKYPAEYPQKPIAEGSRPQQQLVAKNYPTPVKSTRNTTSDTFLQPSK